MNRLKHGKCWLHFLKAHVLSFIILNFFLVNDTIDKILIDIKTFNNYSYFQNDVVWPECVIIYVV